MRKPKIRWDIYYCSQCSVNCHFIWTCNNCNNIELASRTALEDENKKLQSKIISQAKDLQESAKDLQESQSRLNFLLQRFDSENAAGAMKADVAILVQDRKDDLLYAHKFVLAGKSPVFCKMFDTNMLESKTGFVRIEDATLPVMRAVIEFCYNAEINFTADVTFEEVLKVAHKYGFDLLVKICEERLIPTIDNVNLPDMLKLSKKYEAKRLQAGALEYMKTHFDDVSVTVVEAIF